MAEKRVVDKKWVEMMGPLPGRGGKEEGGDEIIRRVGCREREGRLLLDVDSYMSTRTDLTNYAKCNAEIIVNSVVLQAPHSSLRDPCTNCARQARSSKSSR